VKAAAVAYLWADVLFFLYPDGLDKEIEKLKNPI
jgi:hypothetical protein